MILDFYFSPTELLSDGVSLLEKLGHVTGDLLALLLEALELDLLLLLSLASLVDERAELIDARLEGAGDGVTGATHVSGGSLELLEAGLET